MASDFGMSSPTTICKKEIKEKAAIKLINSTNAGLNCSNSNKGCKSLAKAGSPTQPKPREAKVIPN